VGATVTISVIAVSGFTVNLNVFVGGANFKTTAINSSANTVTLEVLGFTGDSSPGVLVAAGAVVNAGCGNLTAPVVTALPITIAQGGTGKDNQSDALTTLLGTTVIPVVNGGTGVAVARAFGQFAIDPDPTLTASTDPKMMGIGLTATITPKVSGTVLIIATGVMGNATIANGVTVKLYYGSGSAPTNGTSAIGTAVGSAKTIGASTTGGRMSFSLAYVITGLTVDTEYWIDIALNSITAGNASIKNVDIVAVEL
jgi:hypothetical protein